MSEDSATWHEGLIPPYPTSLRRQPSGSTTNQEVDGGGFGARSFVLASRCRHHNPPSAQLLSVRMKVLGCR